MGGALGRSLKKKDRRVRRQVFRCPVWLPLSAGCGTWRIACARNVGVSHLQTGTPCQDQVAGKSYESGVTIVALSDGAGSAAYSHYGAYAAVRRAMELVSAHFDDAFASSADREVFKRRLILTLQRELHEVASIGLNLTDEERLANNEPARQDALMVPCNVKSLSCTLLLIAIKGNRYLAVHLGDGVVGAEYSRMGKTGLKVLSGPANGEFANETVFLTSSDAVREAKIITGRIRCQSRIITGFMIMSDGPEAALYDKRSNVLAPACSKLFSANRALDSRTMEAQLLATIKSVIQQKTGDDCSIAIATAV